MQKLTNKKFDGVIKRENTQIQVTYEPCEHALTIGKIGRLLFVSKLSLFFVLIAMVIPLTAFEAHVINVTATIERHPNQCDALSIGYWRSHEGCKQGGEGESIWTDSVRAISDGFDDLFVDITGEEICQALWIPNCTRGNSVESKLCKAKAVTLADELNIASGRLELTALIAWADDGDPAFDNLNLEPWASVAKALVAVEDVLANSTNVGRIRDAAHVAERIYAFYEDENPLWSQCIFSLDVLPPKEEVVVIEGISKKRKSPKVERDQLGANAVGILGSSEDDFATSTEDTATTTPDLFDQEVQATTIEPVLIEENKASTTSESSEAVIITPPEPEEPIVEEKAPPIEETPPEVEEPPAEEVEETEPVVEELIPELELTPEPKPEIL